ncbi:hypothetical protein BC567DRAFT_226146 [Phyllosticta citribraziliensis]
MYVRTPRSCMPLLCPPLLFSSAVPTYLLLPLPFLSLLLPLLLLFFSASLLVWCLAWCGHVR